MIYDPCPPCFEFAPDPSPLNPNLNPNLDPNLDPNLNPNPNLRSGFTAGTGSSPDAPHGLHRQSRPAASALPAITPCNWIASRAYCEHDGV
ncbi:MAG TPA: hypothetical protein VN765_09150 [Candidatus Acidoferrum sp.]|nr:hypothetical protein [Candidatus Acidoferrum sp.]